MDPHRKISLSNTTQNIKQFNKYNNKIYGWIVWIVQVCRQTARSHCLISKVIGLITGGTVYSNGSGDKWPFEVRCPAPQWQELLAEAAFLPSQDGMKGMTVTVQNALHLPPAARFSDSPHRVQMHKRWNDRYGFFVINRQSKNRKVIWSEMWKYYLWLRLKGEACSKLVKAVQRHLWTVNLCHGRPPSVLFHWNYYCWCCYRRSSGLNVFRLPTGQYAALW